MNTENLFFSIKTNQKKKIFLVVLFLAAVLFNSINTYAQKEIKTDTNFFCNPYKSKFEIGAEYLVPTRFSNKIQTISAHGFFWKKRFENISIKISTGFICTYAWGYSSQIENVSDTIIVLSEYKTSAFGAGPVIQMDPTIITIKRFSLIAEANGGVILYSNRFPYGGDIYNFIFRAGPSIAYKMNKNYSIKVGYRWMHISNGQGYGNQNPFYEAQGLNISFMMLK